jgi:hypothetical protein
MTHEIGQLVLGLLLSYLEICDSLLDEWCMEPLKPLPGRSEFEIIRFVFLE